MEDFIEKMVNGRDRTKLPEAAFYWFLTDLSSVCNKF